MKLIFKHDTYFSSFGTFVTDSRHLTLDISFLLRTSFFVGFTEKSLRFRHLNHEERVELHHFFPLDYGDETTGI